MVANFANPRMLRLRVCCGGMYAHLAHTTHTVVFFLVALSRV